MTNARGWGYGFMTEHVPSTFKPLSSIPHIAERKKEGNEEGEGEVEG